MDDDKRKSLNLSTRFYHYTLRSTIKHSAYVDTMNLCRKQNIDDHGTSNEINRDDMMRMTKKDININLPFPICPPKEVNASLDPCLELLKQKSEYIKRMDYFVSQFKKVKKDLNKKNIKILTSMNKRTKGETKLEIPQYLFDITNGNVIDPDKFFSGDHNWYYTGGHLEYINFNGYEYLVRPLKETNVCFTEVNKPSESSIVENFSQPILAINSILKNDMFYVGIRQKNAVKILECIVEDGQLKSLPKCSYKSEEFPLIDFKYNKFDSKEAAILNLGRELILFDINYSKKNVIDIDDSPVEVSNKLMQLDYLSPNSLVMMDRSSMYLLDKRSENVTPIKMDKGFFVCNDLCSFTLSKLDDRYMYLASMHNILKIDCRKMDTVKKWPHLLTHSPIFIKTSANNTNNGEYIFLASQKEDNKVILYDNVYENTFCKQVPSNLETLKITNLTEKFNIHEQLHQRLNLSTAGIAICCKESDVLLYSSNAIGDIFLNTITKNVDPKISVHHLSSWIDSIPKFQKPLIVTDIKNMSYIGLSLTKVVKHHNLEKYTRENKGMYELWSEIDKDNFIMGGIWEDDPRCDFDEDLDDDLAPTITSRKKVSEWLNSKVDHDLTNDMFDDEMDHH